MPYLDMKKKFLLFEINILLAEMGFFSEIKKKKIKFFTKSNFDDQPMKNVNINKENIVNLKYDIGRDIDTLLKEQEKKPNNNESDSMFDTTQELSLEKIIEIRNPEIKKPEIPNFSTDLSEANSYGEINKNTDLFEIELPSNIPIEDNSKQYNDTKLNTAGVSENKKSQRSFMNLGKIKLRNKTENQNKNTYENMNGFTNSNIEFEKPKGDSKETQRKLEHAKEIEKQMKEQIKKRDEQKKREEKLKKLEIKKKIKEERLRQLQVEKAKKQIEKEQIQKEKEKLRIERLKEKEIKKLELKKINEEKQKKRENERIEKQKLREYKKLQDEKEKAEKQREMLLKKKEEELKVKKLEKDIPNQVIEREPPEMGKFIQKENPTKNENPYLDSDVEKLLPIIDHLLEKLPEEVVDEFAHSENFALYEKVMNKYKRK